MTCGDMAIAAFADSHIITRPGVAADERRRHIDAMIEKILLRVTRRHTIERRR